MHSFLFVRVISSGLMCTEIGSYQEYPVDIRFAHRSKTSWWTCLVALVQGTTIEDKNKASIKKKNCMHDKNGQFACRPGSSFSQCFSRCVEGVKPRQLITAWYSDLVYTTPVNSAFRAIWLVPLSRDIKYYSPPGGFRRKKWRANPILS